ncbi:uncharacterized protein [Epargyreus clarus]|uniref:uncharacterized protein isoform X2 n=1 Tax=Epargyreus clarus TaxID=520877 RepID=UPI003C303E6F
MSVVMAAAVIYEYVGVKLPVTRLPCAPPAAGGAPPAVVLVAAEDQGTDALKQILCNSTLSLAIVRFSDTSCFHKIFNRLYDQHRNLSFLFLNEDLSMYGPEVLTVNLFNDIKETTDKRFNFILGSDRAFSVGYNYNMNRYAEQILDTIEKFNPRLENLKDVLSINSKNNTFDIEAAACNWALHNNITFESWISTSREYILFVYLCSNDPLNGEYRNTLSLVKNVIKQEFKFKIDIRTVDCNDAHSITNIFLNNFGENKESIMGALAWSSSAGIAAFAKIANYNEVPVALAGPVAADGAYQPVFSGTIAFAVNGKLEDLANAYRKLLKTCNWSRLAVLSDESSYAKSFKNHLLKGGSIVHIERTVRPETISNTLKSIEKDYARIFLVNTNSTLAEKILLSASQLDMTPIKGYAWIVREWSPEKELLAADWGAMSHLSLGWSWRGGGPASGGRAALRSRLGALWPHRTWPAMAAPLVDATLLLYHSFAQFNFLYSSNPFNLKKRGYAIKFSKIYDEIKEQGLARDLRLNNSSVENPVIYVEHWKGTIRTVITTWHLQDVEERNQSICGLRVQDRPSCLLRGGEISNFVQKCYDPLLFTSIAIFIMLPGVFLLARRARLRRLKRRDLKMLANLFEKKQSSSIVHRDSLYVHKEIGTGNFGRVYLATLRRRRRRSQERSILVAAKALRNDSDKREYLQEAQILEFLDHKNIVKFVGICFANGLRFILMEYALYGDLHRYLKSRRHLAGQRHLGAGDESEAIHVSAEALTRLAGEAAAALEYLAQQGLVHRDVRAANCLVDERRTLKLADFGMARKLCHDQQEYTTIRQALFPVLWMAPESLIHGTFSTSSDVWALGMLFFELATLGQRPYGDWSPQRVLEFVRLGGRPSLPPDMWSQTRSLLTACWQQEAAARPGAAELARFLARAPRAVRPALLPAPPPATLPAPPDASSARTTLLTSDF